ncbi:hypothetical protein [Actinoallomurus iriomotensis]|uniref:Major facilitator superfamily (MFS) profile domain-containing protein n=1 Tax=Actinoallomurus iriomotensis TaxID=478107 RepID=A0A9W6SAW7_9ACTN|nr:hypothetical protein [Actinoallomurus iriomotensis]GLY90286.1 hypothetical protein Airi02_082150 [Actinoallomurus iriomotensis]
MADRYGRKAGFLAGLWVFVVASACCAASSSLWPLVFFRGLVKGPDWGWGTTGTTAAFVCAVLAGVVFTVRTWRHPSVSVEPALVRARTFAWANVTMLLFSVAFGAAVLSMIMWSQDVWHYGALRTGLCVVPGPLLLPVLAAVGQRVAHRVPAALVAGAGCVVFGAGTVVIALSLGTEPHYATELL